MSRYTHSRHVKNSFANAQTVLAKVQAELPERYVEVEVEGISLMRLSCVYLAGFREAKERVLQGVRSIFRLNPAHQ